jgi:phenylacetate-CoA ligase
LSIYNVLARSVMAPTLDFVRGTSTMRCLRDLEQSQWWPLERIQELQSVRLSRLITHAYEHVPYYRRIMDDRGILPGDVQSAADLSQFPVLTKSRIRAAGASLIADNVERKQLRFMSTSGSTGEPLDFYSTAEDQFSRGMARSFRAVGWAGVRIGDRHATLSRPRHYRRKKEQVLHEVSRRVRRTLTLDYGSLSDESLSSVIQQLRRERFSSLGGSPPLLSLVAGYIRAHGIDVPQVNAIVCGGEQLYLHERRLLQDIWGPQPHSKYSSFEVYDIASECDAHGGMHIQAEDVIVEVVEESDLPAPAGRTGTILLTNLHNYAMPFIRYEIGDIGAMDTNPCACGRSLPRLVGMVGRASELIVTRSGRRIFAADIDLESLAASGVRQYRLVQKDLDSVVAFIAWHDDIEPNVRADRALRLAERLRRSTGDDINVTVESVQRIEPTAAGKYLVVESRLASRMSGSPPVDLERPTA